MRTVKVKDEERIHIAQRINQLRLDENISQIEFGKRVGVGRLAVTRWENRAQLPKMEAIRKLAKEFNTTPEWILYGE
ncbi:helix-turn-helix transcriptional regulator [Staphylococcus haemolyticus]|uniref:helix-turn-helix transcriptional regulator n=1 Tax=Staphylococcus haemolyticus TaxID=1283 RepID=UPI0015D7D783|nr:helix-turn-helix transcriptional regulator [Staphylococcus haemolyticus]MCH4426205.1 helix-turn-helix transcriptional regulator [Staphylococcus haemolyticus]MCH4440261.1 helix-turn-helix transcriptional regulator [Staphylococcus haemolyticus]MEB3516886.1 helix-turn-helix transcriptional regulator [Staphylococcus haemolyticus]